jgi:N-acyl-D-amino-acid deacylase
MSRPSLFGFLGVGLPLPAGLAAQSLSARLVASLATLSGPTRRVAPLLALVVVLGGLLIPASALAPTETERYDLLLEGGRLVDGTGNPWRYADVAVLDGRIVRVAPPGRIDRSRARERLDVSGLVVAPGFIDLNGQSDNLYLDDGSALSKLFQGVTTEIMGESNTPAPLAPGEPANHPIDSVAQRRSREWRRFGGWLEEMEAGGVALNVGAFVGGTTVRRSVMGFSDRTPSESEVEQMRQVVRRAMEDGAFGVATALIYPPGAYAGTEELVEIAQVAGEYGGIYITHLRSESYFIVEAIEEALEIGERSGAPVEIFHLKVAGRDNWPLTDTVFQVLADARARGIDVSAGVYPYTAASTGLTACFPPWVQADGGLYRNLADPAARERIRAEMTGPPPRWENWCRLAGPEGSIVATVSNVDHLSYIGRSLAEIAESRGVDWIDLAMDLVLRDRSRVGMIYHAMGEEELRRKLQLPYIKFGTDGAGWNPERGGGQPHPRAYGSYPRILGHYVREEGILTLEDAVRKSSWAVAERIGLTDRGLIVEGFHADIVVFDPETIRERSTFDRPHQLAEGIHHLFVNGEAVISHERATSARPGRFLRGSGAELVADTLYSPHH